MLRPRRKKDIQKEFISVHELIVKSIDSVKEEMLTCTCKTFTESEYILFEETILNFKVIIESTFYKASGALRENINLKISCLFMEYMLDTINEFLGYIAKEKRMKKNCIGYFCTPTDLSQKLIILSGKQDFQLGGIKACTTEPSNNLMCQHYKSEKWNDLREATEIIYPKSKKKAQKDYKRLCSNLAQFSIITAKHLKLIPKDLKDTNFLVDTIDIILKDRGEEIDNTKIIYPEMTKCYLFKLYCIPYSLKSYDTIWDDWFLLGLQRNQNVYFFF